MSKTLTSHIDKNNIFDIFVDFLIFTHFHFMKMHRLLSSAETEYISTKSWYRNINFFLRSNKANFDDVLSINNSRFAEFLPLIYPPELDVKETTDTASSASFLDLYLEFDDWSTRY
jgi:hypothetical protein